MLEIHLWPPPPKPLPPPPPLGTRQPPLLLRWPRALLGLLWFTPGELVITLAEALLIWGVVVALLRYKIGVIPLGGYVKMLGEGAEGDEQEDEDALERIATATERPHIAAGSAHRRAHAEGGQHLSGIELAALAPAHLTAALLTAEDQLLRTLVVGHLTLLVALHAPIELTEHARGGGGGGHPQALGPVGGRRR